jgi:hypothetical protein
MPGASAPVQRQIAAAADHVPPTRRHLRPRLAELELRVGPDAALIATATVADGRFHPFTVGFSLRRRGGRWLVASVSAPG